MKYMRRARVCQVCDAAPLRYAEDNVVVIVDLSEKSVVNPSPAPFARIPIDLLDVTSNSSETWLTDYITRARRAYQKRKRLQEAIIETCWMFRLVQLGIFYVDDCILLTALKYPIAHCLVRPCIVFETLTNLDQLYPITRITNNLYFAYYHISY